MNNKQAYAPYVHSDRTAFVRGTEWLIALLPILIWSVFMFGARVISLCVICIAVSLSADYAVCRYLLKRKRGARCDIFTAVYAVLAVFMMPVAVSLWLPVIAGLLVVLAKNLKGFYLKRLFNPFVFTAAVLSLIFRGQMTTFTKPFAYFSAFDINIDPLLIQNYRVISPLQYMSDGSVYEDGVFAQLYGYASGCIGEIAITAIILAFIWLCIRKEADWLGTVAFLLPFFMLALFFPSSDAESEFFAYSTLLSGAAVFLAVFAMNEKCTVPLSGFGRVVFGAVCGVALFISRKFFGGFEWGYFIVLAMNVLSPFIELITKPKAINKPKKVQK